MGIRTNMGRIVKQGDIYWYTFRAPDKRRPVLLLTRNSAIPLLTGIIVAPVTTLGAFITRLSPEKMREIREAIVFSLGFDALL